MTEDSAPKRANGKPPEKPPTLTPPDATAGEEQKASRTPLLIAVGGLVLSLHAH